MLVFTLCLGEAVLTSCGQAPGFESGGIIVPQTVPAGTCIDPKCLGDAAEGQYALMLLSDCGSCSVDTLKLDRRKSKLRLAILTIHKGQVTNLKEEWPGVPVFCDADQEALPPYCYVFIPQMMLIENKTLRDSAIGAAECTRKWEKWNR